MNVTGCDDCPLYDDDYNQCRHPPEDTDRGTLDRLKTATAPDWCPLRAGPLTIALECPKCQLALMQGDARVRALENQFDVYGQCFQCEACGGPIEASDEHMEPRR